MNNDISWLRKKLDTLFTINVYEPISKEDLINKLNMASETAIFDIIIKELVKEKRITEDSNQYRVTYLGLRSVARGNGRILRDTARLYNLSHVIRKGRKPNRAMFRHP